MSTLSNPNLANLPTGTYIVAVSGGADSIYLLEQLRNIEKKQKLCLVVAHVNHGIRGKESDEDAIFVKKLAKKHNLPFENLKLNLKKFTSKTSFNLEQTARELRYEFLEKTRKKYKAKAILTAHHFDDNIETILLNLIRGASFNGLKGIQQQPTLIRPLLTTTKQEILKYIKQNRIKFRTDKTNTDTRYSRNLLRHKILPLIKTINPSFEKTFFQNIQNLQTTTEIIDQLCNNWLTEHFTNNQFRLTEFLQQPEPLQKNLLVQIYKNLYQSTKKLTTHNLQQILSVLQKRSAGLEKEFGDSYKIVIKKDPTSNSKKKIYWALLKTKTQLKKAHKSVK